MCSSAKSHCCTAVLDNTGQPIRWQGRAASFADYLIQNKLQRRVSGLHVIWSVTIPMVPNHLDKRAHKYLPMVRKAAEKYNVDASLIPAIMQIESSFNPYAVSHSDALGLMQVVQHTAGLDVFRMKGKWGKPSRSYLFDPENNIDTGTAYLSILQDNYLAGIANPVSRRYAVITAYNGGAGSVLRVFSSDKDRAFAQINALSPNEVYQTLTTRHPSAESRRYLYKVSNAQRSYHRFDKNKPALPGGLFSLHVISLKYDFSRWLNSLLFSLPLQKCISGARSNFNFSKIANNNI